jgi:hypothetical protein
MTSVSLQPVPSLVKYFIPQLPFILLNKPFHIKNFCETLYRVIFKFHIKFKLLFNSGTTRGRACIIQGVRE